MCSFTLHNTHTYFKQQTSSTPSNMVYVTCIYKACTLYVTKVTNRRPSFVKKYFRHVAFQMFGSSMSILPQKYPAYRKPGRTIRAKPYSNTYFTNIVEHSVCHNSRGFSARPSRTDQYKHSFFIRTAIDLNHLCDPAVLCDSIGGFKSSLESRALPPTVTSPTLGSAM